MLFEGSRQWVIDHFGNAELGDVRRTRRLVAVVAMMATSPEASLPKQMVDWSDIKVACRLFDCEAVTFEAIARSHYDRRYDCGSQRCLIIRAVLQMMSHVNFSRIQGIHGRA